MAHYTTLKEQYSTLDCMVDEVQKYYLYIMEHI